LLSNGSQLVTAYGVGTLLELVREIAMKLAADGKKVRVCVQGSMGTGGRGCTSCIQLTHSLKPFYLSSETVLPIK
jgi:hypothetical protein